MAPKKQGSGAREISQIRDAVLKLREDLADEARRHKLQMRLAAQSEKARVLVAEQVQALAERGRSLAIQLKDALSSPEGRQKIRQDAMQQIAELRKELARRTEELRRKSVELAELARKSAERARAILQEGPRAPSAAGRRRKKIAQPARIAAGNPKH